MEFVPLRYKRFISDSNVQPVWAAFRRVQILGPYVLTGKVNGKDEIVLKSKEFDTNRFRI